MTSWQIQSIRYVLIGATSNVVLYLAYLGLTVLGMDPELAMTLLFVIGICQSFWFNKRWTFGFSGRQGVALPRFVVAYAGAYLLNLAWLKIFVGVYGMPHQLVQAAALGVNAILLFLLQRNWVFAKE